MLGLHSWQSQHRVKQSRMEYQQTTSILSLATEDTASCQQEH